ncbi:MAG: 2-succinyl-5-enolpyruvyl-6-hydroxy-3-cyclohexene-1-carboxylic-acid synthase [Candidatus Sericytochromatia bacterium]
MVLETANLNVLWTSLMVEELVRHGVTYFCLSPGSRSAPLTVAVARHPQTTAVMAYDERGAAFHALGYARATGRPAVLICSSGTAGAHYLPAVIEAYEDEVPLLILTADRPPELRESGANQTIRQPHLYGDYIRWRFDFPCPDAAIAPEMVLSTLDQALRSCFAPDAGPVHLNVPFREPLAPSAGLVPPFYLEPISGWMAGDQPFTRNLRCGDALSPLVQHELISLLNQTHQGLLLIGQLPDDPTREAVLQLANQLRWPVFADLLSGLRLDPRLETQIPYYDLLLQHEGFRDLCRPPVLLQIGTGFNTRTLLTHLDSYRPDHHILLSPSGQRRDPNFQHTLQLRGDLATLSKALLPGLEPQTNALWRQTLLNQAARVESLLEVELDQSERLSEPAVARLLTQLALPGQGLWAGNSMPIRDLSAYGAPCLEGLQVVGNRGTSGIDGHVACAAGLAQGLKKPVWLLCGDLTLFHDLNSLHQLRFLEQPVAVVVINNHGGGIFSFLPIAEHTDVFEPYFGTPHSLSFAGAAAQFGLTYSAPTTRSELAQALQLSYELGQPCLIEVVTDRNDNLTYHRHLQQALGEALNTGGPL